LIHNDYKFDNVMLDPNDLTKITAVLDWEMVTVGDSANGSWDNSRYVGVGGRRRGIC
jgi:hypothetical protein